METNIKTHKFGIGELLTLGWQLYRKNFKDIVLLTLCVYTPVGVIASLISVAFIQNASDTEALSYISKLNNLLYSLIGVIAIMGIIALTDKSLKGESLSWKEALRIGLSRWLPAVGTNVLGNIIIAGLSLLFIIPGIIWFEYYIFTSYVVALRKLAGKKALDYSKNLVIGQWWRVFGINFVIGIISIILVCAVSFPIFLFPTNKILENFILVIANIPYSFSIVVLTLFFLNNDYLRNHADHQAEQADVIPLITPET